LFCLRDMTGRASGGSKEFIATIGWSRPPSPRLGEVRGCQDARSHEVETFKCVQNEKAGRGVNPLRPRAFGALGAEGLNKGILSNRPPVC
jgi:hypothetical protein